MRFVIGLFLLLFFSASYSQSVKLRNFADTVGFAHLPWQMDTIMARINRDAGHILYSKNKTLTNVDYWKTVISPHDDYTYTGYMYPLVLSKVKAKTIILIGVAHKARKFKLEGQMVFDNFDYWKGPYGSVKVSALRNDIIRQLPEKTFLIHDSCQAAEHSLEAIIPFLQYYNRSVEIIPILIPYMNFETMNALSTTLSNAIAKLLKEKKLEFGKDVAIVISNDAVHYGDTDWGGKNFARFGTDSAGYKKAVTFEHEILNNCILNTIQKEKIKLFTEYTTQKENYKEYNWTWCGRYSVPFGMLTTLYINEALRLKPVSGHLLDYSNSLQNKHISVNDLGGMGITAPCNLKHWVGYVAVGFN